MVLIIIYFGFKFFHVRKAHYPKHLAISFISFKLIFPINFSFMKKIFLILALIAAIHLLFNGENMGVNCLIFNILTIVVLFFQNKESFASRRVLAAVLISLLASLGVFTSNSSLSVFMHITTMMVLIGMAQQPKTRWTMLAWLHSLAAWFMASKIVFFALQKIPIAVKAGRKTNNLFIYSWVAICVFPIFFTIYYFSNQGFASLCDYFFNAISSVLATFSFEFSFNGFLFWIACAFTAALIFTNQKVWQNEVVEAHLTDDITRNRADLRAIFLENKKLHYDNFHKTLALLTHYRIAIVLFVALNLLLFVVNLSDISAVWLQANLSVLPSEISSNLHDGTFTLIFSIILAMVLVAIFFYGNLNFYTKNKSLKTLVYIWTAQNAFLALSVFLRNTHYITAFGLAYYRLGVLIFLLLVIFGLCTMIFKIYAHKTLHYLLRINSWAVLFLLSLTTCFSWDIIITDYNTTNYKNELIDWNFLIFDVSAQNIPQLWAKRNLLSEIHKRRLIEKMQAYQMQATCNDCTRFSYNLPSADLAIFYQKNQKSIEDWYLQFSQNSSE